MMTATPRRLVDSARDYERVERALRFVGQQVEEQPDLEAIAEHIGLSPHHFHRLFARWVGTTPKRFLQYLTIEQAKRRLREEESVLEAAWGAGLSGGGRLHDLMIAVHAMTPGDYKRLGADLTIRYGLHPSPFGDCLVALTDRGLCGLEFVAGRTREQMISGLRSRWPRAGLIACPEDTAPLLERLFPMPGSEARGPFTLLIKGTNFQLQVWRALLDIPTGALTTYGGLARHLGYPGGSRAIGQAVGANPIAWIIPCHRVIAATAGLGGYRWGLQRKQAMLGWEAAMRSSPVLRSSAPHV